MDVFSDIDVSFLVGEVGFLLCFSLWFCYVVIVVSHASVGLFFIVRGFCGLKLCLVCYGRFGSVVWFVFCSGCLFVAGHLRDFWPLGVFCVSVVIMYCASCVCSVLCWRCCDVGVGGPSFCLLGRLLSDGVCLSLICASWSSVVGSVCLRSLYFHSSFHILHVDVLFGFRRKCMLPMCIFHVGPQCGEGVGWMWSIFCRSMDIALIALLLVSMCLCVLSLDVW